MVERAAAAKNAGVSGYHASRAAVEAAARAAGDDIDAPIVDVWTFGTDMDEREAPAPVTLTSMPTTDDDLGLFARLKAALPKLLRKAVPGQAL